MCFVVKDIMKAETCVIVSNLYVRNGNTVYVYDQTTSSFMGCFDIANESFDKFSRRQVVWCKILNILYLYSIGT